MNCYICVLVKQNVDRKATDDQMKRTVTSMKLRSCKYNKTERRFNLLKMSMKFFQEIYFILRYSLKLLLLFTALHETYLYVKGFRVCIFMAAVVEINVFTALKRS